MENRNDIALQQKLDKQQYVSQELIEVRLPVTLPFMNDWSQFESYEGETTINGHHYRYVKRKLEKGELVLLCIPNQNKDNIKKAGDDYFKQVTDLPAEKKAKNNHKVVKVNINEFTSLDVELFSDYTLNHRLKFPTYHSRYSSFKPATPSHPPNA